MTGPDAPPAEPICVRMREAGRLTGLSRAHLYRLLRRGEIERVKVGSATLILMESLKAFIERRRR